MQLDDRGAVLRTTQVVGEPVYGAGVGGVGCVGGGAGGEIGGRGDPHGWSFLIGCPQELQAIRAGNLHVTARPYRPGV